MIKSMEWANFDIQMVPSIVVSRLFQVLMLLMFDSDAYISGIRELPR